MKPFTHLWPYKTSHTCKLPCLLNLPPTHLDCSASFFPLYPPCVGPTCKPAALWTTIKRVVFDAGALSTLVFYFTSEKRFELPAFLRPVFLGSTSIHLILSQIRTILEELLNRISRNSLHKWKNSIQQGSFKTKVK